MRPRMAIVVYAKSVARVAEFYRRTLGVAVSEQTADFAVLTGDGIELSVVRIPEHIAETVPIAVPPALREATPIKPSFTVADLEAVRASALQTGGGVKSLDSAWTWRGMLHLDGFDPEGNVVQFRSLERAT